MIDYTVYNFNTGEIRRSGQTQQSMLTHQPLADDEAMIFGALDGETQYVRNGRATLRPELPELTIDGCGFSFPTSLPDDTSIAILSDFVSDEIEAGDNVAWSMAVPETAKITINPPWPYRKIEFNVEALPCSITDTTPIIPNVDRARAYFTEAVTSQSLQLVDVMLGSPTQETRDKWKLKRSIRDRYLSGVNTAGDDAAMNEAVRYSGLTIAEEIARIAAGVEFEDWVTMRAEGIREETERRLDAGSTFHEVAAAISWAENESALAVAEAQTKLNGE